MIPAAYITEWAAAAPWPLRRQVEQDLILSRLIVEIANDPVLAPELAMRGGTCLHKLHLPQALRYSEDLDYVRRTRSGIKPYLTALRELTERVGLREKATERSGDMVHFVTTTPAEDGREIVVKIEINIAETDAVLPRAALPFSVKSRWWSGACEVSTFAVEELMATKLRALYQRRNGRDLFDVRLMLADLEPDTELVVRAFQSYMGTEAFTYPELRLNLRAKLGHPDFRADLAALTTAQLMNYEPERAADLLMEQIGPRLRNAPPSDEIAGGAWRA